jgi:DNA-binding transcriptional MocR family regulator
MPPGWRGEPELLDRLAELFDSPPERTIVNGGVRQFATSWAVRTTIAIVEAPTFADIPVILGAGAAVRRLPWSALTNCSLADEPAGTIWLTNPFRNPDGRSLDPALMAALDQLTGRGHAIVVNQVYRWYEGANAVAAAPATAWTVTSLAKLAGNGARLGWATATAADAIPRTLTSDGPPTAWQRAWARFLTRRNFQALWADCVEPTLDARQAFTRRVDELLGWNIPGGGPCVLLDCVDMDEATVIALLAGQGLQASPGSAFENPVDSIRLSFSGTTAAEAKEAAERITRLATRFRLSNNL